MAARTRDDVQGEVLPSPVAAAFVKVVSDLPQAALADLERLLAAHLASPTAVQLREARLGLLIELVSDSTGELPATDRYEQARRERAARGEHWPSYSTLSRAYGTWPTAVRAAMRVHFDGSPARVAYTHKHAHQHSDDYTREEVIAALVRFRNEQPRWPSSTQFFRWGADLRRLAREGGHPDPRIPSPKPVRSLFGGFRRGLEVAKQRDGRP